MNKHTLLPLIVSLLSFVSLSACHAKEHVALPKEVVVAQVHKLYPGSDGGGVTIAFHSILIAKPHKAGQYEIYGIQGGTVVYPVLASFSVTTRTNDDPTQKSLYTVREVTEKYMFYKDEFGKWEGPMVSSAENSDKETARYWK